MLAKKWNKKIKKKEKNLVKENKLERERSWSIWYHNYSKSLFPTYTSHVWENEK